MAQRVLTRGLRRRRLETPLVLTPDRGATPVAEPPENRWRDAIGVVVSGSPYPGRPLSMSLFRCNGCSERPEAKMSQVTWAWRRADGVRVAYRGRLCTACFASKIAPLSIDYKGVERLTCPACGIDTDDDPDVIYTTSYIDAYGEFKTESPFCNPCAANYRIWVQEHSWPLEDQRGATGGPSTHPSADEILRSMGIAPRGS